MLTKQHMSAHCLSMHSHIAMLFVDICACIPIISIKEKDTPEDENVVIDTIG